MPAPACLARPRSQHPPHLAAIAFALAAYALMFSAFQTLNAEGQALWILYSVPHSLESVLWQKARLWAAVAADLSARLVCGRDRRSPAAFRCNSPERRWSCWPACRYSPSIATALGVFGCDPLEPDIQRRVRPTYMYLYMLLVSLYVYAIYAPSIWQRAAMIILTALVAMALWQKARDRFDYLLDPSASPPPRVSLVGRADRGAHVLRAAGARQLGRDLASARTASRPGSVSGSPSASPARRPYGLMRLVYWRARTADVPARAGRRRAAGIAAGG